MNEEIVAIVDSGNRVTGSAKRSELRRLGLWHRVCYVFVFDTPGLLYTQHRTMTKDSYPGYWDLAAGGIVLAGESYEESARRELAEELGIEGVAMDLWFDFRFEDGLARAWGRAFGCVYDGPLRLQAEEVQSVERLRVEDALAGISGKTFTPDSLLALRMRFSGPA